MKLISHRLKVEGKLSKAVEDAVTSAGADLLRRSNQKVPIDTGDLAGSGSMSVDREQNRIEASIGYNTPYAVEVHENLKAFHPNGGEAKFLENAYTENAPGYERLIEDALRESMK